MTIYCKQPGASVRYVIDWGGALNGRRVAASDWTIYPAEPGGLAVTAEQTGPVRTRAVVTGGLAGGEYRLTACATFADGSRARREVPFRVTP